MTTKRLDRILDIIIALVVFRFIVNISDLIVFLIKKIGT